MTALKGLKVVDLTHIMAGPACTLMLADMGADVIKVEKIPGGDDTRRSIPPQIGDQAASFLMMNRNKRGIAVDLRSEGGKEVLRRLLKDADVVVENYRRQTLPKLGFDYEDLRKENPGLIYCAISGFGRTGPYADRGGFDLVAQAMSGIMSITGTSPDEPPVKCGPPLTDITAGLLAVIGILAALRNRETTGQGQMVETSLLEAGIIHTYWQSAMALATGEAPGPMGSAHPLSAPYQAFEARDGWIVVGGANQANWLRLVDVLEAPQLAEDPRFKTNADRMANLPALEAELNACFRQRDSAEWLELLDAAGVPSGPVNDVVQMHQDPQVLAREMVTEIPHTTLGSVKTLGLPIKFSDTPGGPRQGAPVLGEHTRDVLAEQGFTAEEIDRLVSEGAVIAADLPSKA
ncbi:CaiB/BaiF CoA transferase family protein [Aquibaculum arenosum]|uniref:CoA transferase n=1 Tax=Aquibaculum arenosum TaxID=3032591 RepID=A0ABT5YNZ5_9PROT|nr:CoA transferase [Fodinicurvata sp. CAU 1616]MDF2096460.1 CoA transferase [Fodinicurvata sp. CAU 1616]